MLSDSVIECFLMGRYPCPVALLAQQLPQSLGVLTKAWREFALLIDHA